MAAYQKVTLSDAREFHKRFYGAQEARFGLLGPIDCAPYEQWIREQFANWQPQESYRRVPYPLFEPTPTRLVFNEPDNANVGLRGYQNIPLAERGMDRERLSLLLASRIIGGGPGSRLWKRMREQEGLSYDVGMTVGAGQYDVAGHVSVSAEVAPRNVSRAEAALRDELDNSLNKGFSQEELDNFRTQLLQDRKRARSGDQWALSYMFGQMEFEYPRDEYERSDAIIASLSLEDVNATWRKFVKPEKFVWGIFGDQNKVQ